MATLLDILAGRKNKENFSGKLLIEGLPPPDNFKCTVGYVAQNDALMGTLTVRENLEFSAALRLPSSVYNAERRKIVEHVINELGLHHCADAKMLLLTLVGNKFIPGVSGGERKRTCIGMELIISPKILFLDEPTTGLDANAASAVMLLLKGLALKGTTIVFTIYQPRYSIYRLFDHLTLLSRGETVYHGPAVNALDFFHNIGYDIQDHNNPADFFLDVINGDISTFYANNANKCDAVLYVEEMLSDIAERLEKQDELVHIKLVDGYKKSPIYSNMSIHRLHDTLKKVLFDYEQNSREVTDLKQQRSGFTNGFIQRFGVIAAATLKNNLRNPMGFISQAAAMTIFACVVGAIYWQIQTDCKSGLQNRKVIVLHSSFVTPKQSNLAKVFLKVGVFFLILMYLTLMNLSAIDLFISERPILVHESACRIHKVFSYFFAFIICDVIPNRLIPDVIFTVIAYFMIGFDKDVEKFFFFLLTIFLFSMAGAGVAYFFSSAFGPYANTNLVVAVVFVIMLVFGGFFVNTDSVPDWLEWIKWISIFRYGLKATTNFGIDKECHNPCSCNGPSGNDYLKSQDIAYVTVWDKWQNIVALGVMSLLFFLLTFIVLLRVKKIK
ncbi:hypothetical protein KUTeg_004443 [Tegillarca granosa]|uniref:ABC transporter domain-containing protein n=1 Tax=Tegillarca granosa TaxID=220873 RepID=A0ABQ9FRP6_TEGGR|nr:hypothetical protein KUTeg_004443 [Tegillarca granosa]